VFPALLGLIFYLLSTFSTSHSYANTYEYSPIYSFLLFLWALTFVEWWRAYELVLALRFGTRGAFRVEKTRAQFTPGLPWWKRELRVLASIPVILVFAGVLAMLLTGIFALEAFVTQLYTGPGHKYIVCLSCPIRSLAVDSTSSNRPSPQPSSSSSLFPAFSHCTRPWRKNLHHGRIMHTTLPTLPLSPSNRSHSQQS
jgi:hypothetical protein